MSPDEFRELLQSKGVAAGCPVCGAEDWRGLEDIVDLPVRIPGPGHDPHVRIPGFEALAPSCGRCGHVRLIDLRWLERPAGEEADAEQERKPGPDAESPGTGQRTRGRFSDQPLTNIWGQPVSKPRRRKH